MTHSSRGSSSIRISASLPDHMNPNPDSLGLALDIDESDNALDLDLARSVAPYFRIRDAEALRTITRLREIMAGWRAIAAQLGIARAEQDRMAPAFHAAG